MSDSATPYCLATVVREVNPPQEEVSAIGSFEELIAHLRATHGWFADRMADFSAEDDKPTDGVLIGGFGVQLRNRWGSLIEVGVGREIWFLMQHEPQPARCYSDRPALDGDLVFWLGGWHHTELGRDMLVTRSACLDALYQWLESGELPNSDKTNQTAGP